MNILLFSPEVSHPQNAGNRKRIYNFGKYLQSQGHTIHFVYFAQSTYGQESLDLMQNEWDSFTLIERTHYSKSSTTGYALDAWYQDDIQDVVNDMIETLDIQAVLVNYLMQSKLLEYVPKHVLKIIDTHDIFTDRYKLYEDAGIFSYGWYSVSKEDEAKGLSRADVVLAIQKQEADYFSTLTDTEIRIVGHLEDSHLNHRRYGSLKKIGFVGSHNEINEDAITKFLDRYLDSDLLQDVDIVIAGNICNKIKREHPNLKLRGVVDNLDAFYTEIDLAINPLLFGTGLKIKTIEALSYGVPIVSTKIGFEGIESGEVCHQLDTIDEMIDCIETIYHTPEKLERLAKLSKETFEGCERDIKKEIESLFSADIKIKPVSSKLKKQEETVSKLYNQLQVSIFSRKEEKKKQELRIKELLEKNKKLQREIEYSKKDFTVLHNSVEKMVQFPIKIHPLKKYRAYKAMLKTFLNISENIFLQRKIQ